MLAHNLEKDLQDLSVAVGLSELTNQVKEDLQGPYDQSPSFPLAKLRCIIKLKECSIHKL